MAVSAQTIWALLLLTGCLLPCIYMSRPGGVRLDVHVTVIAGGLVGVTCACAAAIYATAA